MRMRLDATTRSPASSSILVTAPVRLRRVASGLMIEKVRVTAMKRSGELRIAEKWRLPSHSGSSTQAGAAMDANAHKLEKWRKFLREIGGIVIGVLIALALGAVATEIGWAIDVRAAKGALAE